MKNRSRVRAGERELLLFPNCVKSIVESVKDAYASELIVCDWDSEDWPLKDWLSQTAHPLSTRIVPGHGEFSRGRGRNLAAASAKGDVLCFLDADVLLPPAFFRKGLKALEAGMAFFPILFSYSGPEHTSGYWSEYGYGNCMVARQPFAESGGWPEYISWGKEDTIFFERISSLQGVVRKELAGFYHQWHPDAIEWKDQYAGDRRSDGSKERDIESARNQLTRKLQTAIRKLVQLIPPPESMILVDEQLFWNSPEIIGRSTPFPERNGEFWGRPANDADAISELKRQIESGAGFLVFAWPAFWWMDHYAGFADYLRTTFSCVQDDDQLLVFDVRQPALREMSHRIIDRAVSGLRGTERESIRADASKVIQTYWCECGPREQNFGDKLTPLLLASVGLQSRLAQPESADLFGVGSITHNIPDGYSGFIWSSGDLYEDRSNDFRKSHVLALRGRLTLEKSRCREGHPLCLGDGGLLAHLLHQPAGKEYPLGLVPHYVDFDHPCLEELAARNPEILVIDPCGDVHTVLRQIGQCRRILSSSLHGLVVADSFGIPNRWVTFPGESRILGAGFKFRDYYSVFEMENVAPVQLSRHQDLDSLLPLADGYARPGISKIQSELATSLKRLASELKSGVRDVD